jgi:curli biogenesis system outer membrane secretion channel CsgG
MRRAGVLVMAMVMFGALVPAADASRAPTKRERAAIKRVALNKCNSGGAPEPCRFHKARVSTKNARYAWADVTTEGFSAVLLKRANTKTRRFKVVGTQGGGVGDCSYWRKRAPRAVLKDLKVYGVEAGSGATGICG